MTARVPMGLILSHHPPCQHNRTLLVPFFRFRLCARCFGEAWGLVICLWLLKRFHPTPSYPQVLMVGLFSLPAIIDWSTQAIGWRESNNYLRIMTGGMFAAACVQTGYFLAKGSFIYGAASLIIIIFEGMVALRWLKRSGAFERILAPFEDYAKSLGRDEA